jgi:hypothetical protein
MTRVIGIFPQQDQVGAVVDSLRNIGFDRKDMIITDTDKSRVGQVKDDAEITDIQTELEGFFEKGPYTDTLQLHGSGLVVALEVPRKKADRVREIMEQSGATDIQMET